MPRITAGRLKNKPITTLKGEATRPTLEKTRAMIMNVLHHRFDLSGFKVVDLFAGSGALGLEAYSWGAEEIFMVESQRRAYGILQENTRKLGLEKAARLCCMDGLEWLKKFPLDQGPYLIFLDPPYESDLAEKAMLLVAKQESARGSVIVWEHALQREAELHERLVLLQDRKFGATVIEFFEVE